jgi:hypothetical protein
LTVTFFVYAKMSHEIETRLFRRDFDRTSPPTKPHSAYPANALPQGRDRTERRRYLSRCPARAVLEIAARQVAKYGMAQHAARKQEEAEKALRKTAPLPE